MRGFRYKLTLRLQHPSMTMADITRGIGLAPEGGWNVGEPRRKPPGSTVTGFNKQTYWYAQIDQARKVDLADALDLQLRYLEKRKAFMTAFLSSGGSADYFIGWFMTDPSSGHSLPASLMGRMAALNIELGLDIYAAKPA